MNNMKNWNALDWKQIEETVFIAQQAMYIASKAKDINTVRHIQIYLLNINETKYLAVKIVTSNSRSKTPDIDNWIEVTEEDKFMIANNLTLDGNSSFIRRVYISKPGTRDKRPLGIQTIIDRCKQCLCKLVLEPEFEAKFESNSYGFRPGRSAIDAIAKIRSHLIFKGPCYVLDTYIRKCFDRINHVYLINKINPLPIIARQIYAWLKAGIFDKNEIIFPKEGTSQVGIISPLLVNIALDGIQQELSDIIFNKFRAQIMKETYFIRYADDLVVLGPTIEVIETAKTAIENFLRFNGLELKDEATRIIYTLTMPRDTTTNKFIVKSEYFDFLGFRFKQRYLGKHRYWKAGNKVTHIRTLVLPSPDRIERHKASIHALLRKIGDIKTLIQTLNPRIIGWTNYFKYSDGRQYGDLPRKLDLWMNVKIRKWIRRTSKKRGKTSKFWKQDNKDWVLFHKDPNTNEEITLKKYSSYQWSIYDYKAINSYFSPYGLNFKEYKDIYKKKNC